METSASTAAGKKEGKGAVLEGNGFPETGKKPASLAGAQGGTLCFPHFQSSRRVFH
uniref:Uncharacterized protein n=1 Tax=Gopherus evgoodei TaxID=1825980 RepID=A0A8C4Y7K2_9SAUR